MSFGVLNEPEFTRNYDFEVVSGSQNLNLVPIEDLPEEYTLPEELIPEVHDQYDTMKCVAFSMCECAESARLKFFDEKLHYSEDWNYGRDESRIGYRGTGLFVSNAIKGALKIGFVPRKYFNYPDDDAPEIIDRAERRDDLLLDVNDKIKPSSYVDFNYPIEKRWNLVRQALYTYKTPLLIVSNKYFSCSHAIIMIGWSSHDANEKSGRFIKFQNSWGKKYRDNGRYYFDVNYMDKAYMFFWNDLKLPFSDVSESDWFCKEVKGSYFSGLIKGVSDDKFEPESNIIRGDLAIILDRFIKKSQRCYNTFVTFLNDKGKNLKLMSIDSFDNVPFYDLQSDDYYADSIRTVYANGLMNGTDENLFSPKDGVTRSMLAAISVRTYYFLKSKFCLKFEEDRIQYKDFEDVSKDEWYYQYIVDAYGLGIMKGEDKIFRPEELVTRAEASVVLYRLFKIVDNDLLNKLI